MPKSVLEHKHQEIRYRDRIICLLGCLLLGLFIAYLRFPTIIDVHRVPDPGRLLSHKVGDIPKTHVHAFARLALETIYHCGEDCSIEIPANVNALRAYVTDECASQTKARVERNPNLFSNRSRQIQFQFDKATQGEAQFQGQNPIGNADRNVNVLDDGTWTVDLEYNLRETVAGYQTIDANIFYPVRIVRSSLPKNINEYQLAFDCFYDQVVRTEPKKDSPETPQ